MDVLNLLVVFPNNAHRSVKKALLPKIANLSPPDVDADH
jgi:hypothetical protein